MISACPKFYNLTKWVKKKVFSLIGFQLTVLPSTLFLASFSSLYCSVAQKNWSFLLLPKTVPF